MNAAHPKGVKNSKSYVYGYNLTSKCVFSSGEIIDVYAGALKFHPNYWETFPWPCVLIAVYLCGRGESAGSLRGSGGGGGS